MSARDTTLTKERLADLQAYARGEQPDLQPLRLRWHREHGYLVPAGPRKAPHDGPVSRRIPPRPHKLTTKGRLAVNGAPVAVAPRPAQPRTGYQSDSLKRSPR